MALAHNTFSYPLFRGSASACLGFLRKVWLSQQISMLRAGCASEGPTHILPLILMPDCKNVEKEVGGRV